MLVKADAPCHPLTRLLYSREPVYNPKLERTTPFAIAESIGDTHSWLKI